jgi:molybdate transport system permease protein
VDLQAFSLTSTELAAFGLSVRVALWASVLSLVPGVAIAWLLARKQFVGKALLDAFVHLPLVLPPVVPGYLLLLLFGNQGLLGQWLHARFGITLAFTWKGAVLASAVMAFPLLVRALRLSIAAVDRRLEQAALSLGAHPLRVFFTVTLPLSMSGLLTGLLLSFSRSLGEFGATMAFVGNIPGETRTLPLAIYSAMQVPDGEPGALRLIVLSLGLAFAALLAGDYLAQRIEQRLGK